MPRMTRLVGIGLPHHVTQRGNHQQNVFLTESDRVKYLEWIQEYGIKYQLKIITFCLMHNHVHFIVIPEKEDSISKTFNIAQMRYAQYFNKINNTAGHLWQGRYFSCILDETHLISAARYIERNPVRSKIVKKPWNWKWSSSYYYINKIKCAFDFKKLFEIINMSQGGWEKFIDSAEDEEEIQKLRKYTLNGRPLGAETFMEKLEVRLNKKLHFNPKGRPCKIQAQVKNGS